MPTYNLPHETSINFSKGPEQLLVYIAGEVGIFIPLFLFAFFMIICFSGFFLEQRRTGRGDFSQWFVVAGFLTSGMALFMTFIDGLITIPTVIICIAITIGGALWFLTSRNNN